MTPCRACKNYVLDLDGMEESCLFKGELNLPDCSHYRPTVDEVRRQYAILADRERNYRKQMRTAAC